MTRNDLKISFEFFPPKTETAEATLWDSIRRLEPMAPDFVSVTYGAGGSTRDRTHRTVQRMVTETSLKPAAHLTCVGATREEIRGVLNDYKAAGVSHIVALRGDPPTGMGTNFVPTEGGYTSSVDLIEDIAAFGAADKDGFEISVSAYPEPHPESRGWDRDIALLKAKQDAGATRAITQFFFEPEPYFDLLDRARYAGVTIPIIPGIMLQPNFKGLKRIAGLVSATLPDWLHSLYDGLEDDPETRDLVTANVAAELTSKLADQGVTDFHFYTLNRAGLALSTCRLLGVRPDRIAAAA